MVARTSKLDSANPIGEEASTLSAGGNAVLEEARGAVSPDDDRKAHLSFRAPMALIEGVMRESGATNSSETRLLALAMLAHPDPTASLTRATHGQLRPNHQLEY